MSIMSMCTFTNGTITSGKMLGRPINGIKEDAKNRDYLRM
jgi:hypothetical protein